MTDTTPALASTPPKPLALTLDMALYLEQLEHMGTTIEQKEDYILAMWSLLLNFAELGFEIHPVQQAMQARQKHAQLSIEKPRETPENTGLTAQDVLCLFQSNRTRIIPKSDVNNASEDRKGAP